MGKKIEDFHIAYYKFTYIADPNRQYSSRKKIPAYYQAYTETLEYANKWPMNKLIGHIKTIMRINTYSMAWVSIHYANGKRKIFAITDY